MNSVELLIRKAGWHSETLKSSERFLSRPRVFVASGLIIDVNLLGPKGLDLQKCVTADRTDLQFIFTVIANPRDTPGARSGSTNAATP